MWTAPHTFVAGEIPTAAQWNAWVSDNLAWLGTDAPTCLLTHSASQELATDNTFYELAFNTETHDPGGMHDPAENTKITVPVAGLYWVTATLSFEADADGYRDVTVRKNGTNDVLRAQTAASPTAAVETVLPVAGLVKLAADDYLEVRGRHNAGGAIDAVGGVDYSPLFGVAWVRNV